MDKTLKVAVILAAYDRMSQVVNNVVNKTASKLAQLQKYTDKLGNKSFELAKNSGAIGLAIGAPLALAAKNAVDFEDAMADVAKVMNLKIGSSEFKAMSEQALSVQKTLGILPDQAAALMANLAQGGIAAKDLKYVSVIAGQMGIAFDMSSDQAGDAFVKLKNAMNLSVSDSKKAVDAFNHLSDGTASKASEIVTFMASGGAGVARTLKMGAADMAAFGSVLVSNGKSAAEAATIMERFQKGVLSQPQFRKMFNAAGGGSQGLLAVLNAGAKSNDPFAFFQKFGEYGTSIDSILSKNLIQVQDALKMVADETNYANSAAKEFENRNSTVAGKIRALRGDIAGMSVRIGNSLIPVLHQLLAKITPIIEKTSAWIQKNPVLTAQILKATAYASGFFLAVSGVSTVVGSIAKLFNTMSTVLGGFTKVVKWAIVGQKGLGHWIFVVQYRMLQLSQFMMAKVVPAVLAFGKTLLASPITWYVAGIVAIAAAVYLVIKHWDKIRSFFIRIWESVKSTFSRFWSWAKTLFLNYTPQGLVIKHWSKITAFFSNLWATVKGIFVGHVNFVFGLGPRFFEAGKNIVLSIWNGIKALANKPIEAIKAITQKMRDYLPFSPAKEGAFRDLHQVKIIETIISSMRPDKLVNAMGQVTTMAFNAIQRPTYASSYSPSAAGGSSNITLNITVNGVSNFNEFVEQLKRYPREVAKAAMTGMKDIERKKF